MHRILSAAFAGFAMLSGASLHAATLIPVAPVPGSIETDVFVINDNNEIAGGYIMPDNSAHGFAGPLGGPYATFDFGTGATSARGIDNDGNVVGVTIGDGSHCSWLEFVRTADGTISQISKGKKAVTGIPGNFSTKGQFAGDYCQKNGTIAGYIGRNGKYQSDVVIDADNATTSPRGINKAGTIAGFFVQNTGGQTGFVLKDGVTTTVSFPDQSQRNTLLQSLNNSGIASGHWSDSIGNWHPVTYDTGTGLFTVIDVPGATSAMSFGINSAGLVPITSDAGSFIYCPLKKKNCPTGGTGVAAHPKRSLSQVLISGGTLRY